jgi:hypothetical protein
VLAASRSTAMRPLAHTRTMRRGGASTGATPASLGDLLTTVSAFADPVLRGQITGAA